MASVKEGADALGEEGEEVESLESLLEASRTPEGRSLLTGAGALAAALRRLHAAPPPLLLSLLRLLRNLCAGETANQDAFLAGGGPDRVATVILSSPALSPEVLRAGVQLLGNVALAGEESRSAVWARLFPIGFLELARVRESKVGDPLCMVLDTCCSAVGGRRRLEELCEDGRGLPILKEIVTTASIAGYQEEWLEWLLCKICMEEPYFSILYAKLGLPSLSDGSGDIELRCTFFTTEQTFLLSCLSKCLSERPKDVVISNAFAIGILDALKDACHVVDFTSRGSAALPTGSPSVDVLGYSLVILRDICAWEDLSSPTTKAPVDSLLSAGLLELLLTLLRELEPPSTIRKSMEQAKDQAVDPSLAGPFKVCPYKGFRRDVVSVIGNCLNQRKEVQDEIRLRNGILLLLQQCVLDEDNPFLREWGLLAVRNLLEGNAENQREVAELELQEPVVTPEIADLGIRVEVDEQNRRVKLVNT